MSATDLYTGRPAISPPLGVDEIHRSFETARQDIGEHDVAPLAELG